MKKKRIANDLLQSLQEAAAMEKGELKGRETNRKLSRPATVRAWEQGQRTPDGAAARLLEVLSKETHIADDLAS